MEVYRCNGPLPHEEQIPARRVSRNAKKTLPTRIRHGFCDRKLVDSQRHDRSKTEEIEMDEEIFNMSLRKFLKKVGVTSQREIEQAVRAAIENGSLNGETAVQAKVTLTIDAIGLSENIDGEITLS
jgi:hypothetical protein